MVVMPFYAPESQRLTDRRAQAQRCLQPPRCHRHGLTAFLGLVPKVHPSTWIRGAVAPFLDDKDFFTYEDESRDATYNLVAMGGTFDNLHGHKRLLLLPPGYAERSLLGYQTSISPKRRKSLAT